MDRKLGIVSGTVGLVALLVAGCDSGGDGGANQKRSARDSVDSARHIATLEEGASNDEALSSIGELYEDLQGVTGGAESFGGGGGGSGGSGSRQANLSDCPVSVSGGTSIDQRSIPNGSVSGQVKQNQSRVDFEMTVQASQRGNSVTVDESGSVEMADDTINGCVEADVQISAGGAGSFSITSEGSYNGVQLDKDGCPVGGSLTVATTNFGQTTTVTASFGPTCGDVTIQ